MTDNSSPYFSVIIPTYNRAHCLLETIQSVLDNTFTDFEVIVVDDGSTDTTEVLIKSLSDPRIKYIYQSNKERGAARNLGMQIARGKFITFLDSDDRMKAHCLTTACEKTKEKEMHFFHFRYQVCTPEGNVMRISPFSPNSVPLKFGNYLSCLGVFIHQSVSKQFFFSEQRDLSGTEDWLFWLEIERKFHLYGFPDVVCTLIQHIERSTNSLPEEKIRQVIKILEGEMNAKGFELEDVQIVMAHMYTYLALHMSLQGKRGLAVRAMMDGFYLHPRELFKIRILAIFKHLIFS